MCPPQCSGFTPIPETGRLVPLPHAPFPAQCCQSMHSPPLLPGDPSGPASAETQNNEQDA